MPCIKIDKPFVNYTFWQVKYDVHYNVAYIWQNLIIFTLKCHNKFNLVSYDKIESNIHIPVLLLVK